MNYDTETIIVEAEKSLSSAFEKINETALCNQKKVLDAFRNHCVAARHFYGTTGYGYDDVGRDTLNKIYAEVFGCEAAIVSPYISSGTQALTVALFGVLRTGHKAVSLTGEPYDTLNKVIFGRDNGSLADFGIGFDIIAMDNGVIDERAVEKYLSENSPELVYIQRSRGYTSRNALTVADIGKAVDQEVEGTHVQIGADLAKKYRESKEVVNAIMAHHGDVDPMTVEAVLVAAADAVSGARPGARRETIENYVKRLEKLEEIASDFNGVQKVYALQAGREVRVIVKPEVVNDPTMVLLAKDIAKKIESEMEYPGQIKVNVIRETRSVEYAK